MNSVPSDDDRMFSPSGLRNRDALLDVLNARLRVPRPTDLDYGAVELQPPASPLSKPSTNRRASKKT